MRVMQQGGRRIWPAALAAAVLAILGAAVALAAPGSLTFVEQQKDGFGGVDGLDSAGYAATSPDGRYLYVTGFNDDALDVFARTPGTGALTFLEMHKDGVGGIDGLFGIAEVSVSPDGRHVYVAGQRDDAIAVFSRDPATGRLAFVQQQKDGIGGVDGLDGAFAIATSPDGKHVYVASFNDDAVAVFSRDPATGGLTFIETHKDGVGGVDGLDFAEGLMVAPDGRNVYVTGTDDDAVAAFSRDPASGSLTFLGMHKDGLDGVDGLDGAWGVAASPDAKHVYVASLDDDAVAVFSRDPVTGALSFVEVQKDAIGGVDGLDEAEGVAVSPDGENVYVTGHIDDAVAEFTRNPATGSLAFLDIARDGVGGVDGLDGAFGIHVACDGRSVYAMGDADDAVAAFSREGGAPGTCAPDLELLASKQKIDKAVEATATCGLEACTVEVTGKLKGVRKKPALKPATEEIDFDEDQALSLGLGRRARRKARKARKEGEKVFAKMTATATDLAGNDALPETVKIKLK
jgi:6-phosphogluconolactonase (cycloisomerase 2 family)